MRFATRFTFAALLAGWSVGATSSSALSATPASSDSLSLSPNSPIYAQAETPTPPRPLMALLDKTPAGPALEDARINLSGYIEGSWTHNFRDPAGGLNLGRVFDIQNDDPTLNQLALTVERQANLSSTEFDLGFRADVIFGGDSRFIHSNGMMDNVDFFDGPENQFDFPQVYADLALPVGNGLRVRVGKFLFFKQIDPNASVFYSHSYTFGAALPFTLTGVTGFYRLSEQWSVEGGISRGWGQSLQDNNDAIDALFRLTYRPDDRTSVSVLGITGPELDDNNGAYRTAVDFTISHELNDKLTLLLDAVYGTQSDAPGIGQASWFGVAGYGVYQIDPHVAAALRLEWFRDDKGFVTGTSTNFGGFGGQNLYEITAGVTITPFPTDDVGRNFKVRPEVRYDYSSQQFFDGLTGHEQLTFAVDAIFNF